MTHTEKEPKNAGGKTGRFHKVKRVFSAVVTALLIISTLLCFTVVIKTSLGGEPSLFGFRFFVVVTGSMEPTIPVGSVVVVHRQDTYEVDDIVTFLSEEGEIAGSPNTHRIVNAIPVEEAGGTVTYFVTKGDHNPAADVKRIRAEQIYGKVVFQTGEYVGRFMEFLLSPQGFLCIIILPVLLIALLFMKSVLRQLKAVSEARAAQIAGTEGTGAPTGAPESTEKKTTEENPEEPETPAKPDEPEK